MAGGGTGRFSLEWTVDSRVQKEVNPKQSQNGPRASASHRHTMKIVAFGVLVMLLVALATAAPGSYFSKADSDAVKALIKAEAKGGDYGSPQANLAAAEASALLGAPLTATSAICDSALKGTYQLLSPHIHFGRAPSIEGCS